MRQWRWLTVTPTNLEEVVVTLNRRMADLEAIWAELRAERGARLYHSSDQVYGAGVVTTLNWDSESFDTANLHDLTTNNQRITVPNGEAVSLWGFGVLMFFSGNAGATYFEILKNGTNALSRYAVLPTTVTAGNFSFGALDLAEAGDYYEVRVVTVATTGAVTVESGDGAVRVSFSGAKIGTA